MNVEPIPAAAQLTAEERHELIKAVEQWEEWSAAFYVDHYLAPAVLRLIERRAAGAADPGPTAQAGPGASLTGREGSNRWERPTLR